MALTGTSSSTYIKLKNDKDFYNKLKKVKNEDSSYESVIIITTMNGCNACEKVKPVVKKFSKQHKILTLEAHRNLCPTLIELFKIRLYPTIIYLKWDMSELKYKVNYKKAHGSISMSTLIKIIGDK